MIDGIKFIVSENLEQLRNHPLLDFKVLTSKTTGELIKSKYPISKYKGFTFEDKKKNIEVRGSIHKYFNNGDHNWNDFSFYELVSSIKQFCLDFNFNPFGIKIDNIEIGVNINVPFNSEEFLNSFIMYSGNNFDRHTGKHMNYRECSLRQYYIKIYDKGLQYKLSERLVRFEIKFIKMECPNRLGIRNLSDLFLVDNIKNLSRELLRIYDDIYMGDVSVNIDILSSDKKEIFLKGFNYSNWKSEKPNKNLLPVEEFKRAYKKYEHKLKNFRDILELTGANEKNKLFRNMVEVKIEQLLDFGNSSILLGEITGCNKIGNGGIDRLNIDEMGEMTGYENHKLGGNGTLLYSVSFPSGKRLCIVTGLDISMQKETSLFLCTTGIKYYKRNHPYIWIELRKRLSKKWMNMNENVQINEIAHSVRNEFNNSYRGIVKCYRYPSLFDQSQFLRKDKLRMFLLKDQSIVNNNNQQCYAL